VTRPRRWAAQLDIALHALVFIAGLLADRLLGHFI
jgi:hypothetical protein